MAVAQKKRVAEPLEVDSEGKPPVIKKAEAEARQYDEITYRPGNGDAPFTKWNGIEFRANIPVKVPRNKTVLAPLKRESQLADGTIVSRAIEQHVPMVDLARGNPIFSVNGVDPEKRNPLRSKPPTDVASYKGYCTEWIARAETAIELESRWKAEEALRARCGVDDHDLQHIMPFFEIRLEMLRGDMQLLEMG